MPAAPRRSGVPTGVLILFLRLCASLEEECVLGIVGLPVSLPCIQPQLLTSVNFSLEWRRGEEVVLRSAWKDDGDVEEWSVNRATTPADATLTGNVSLQLPVVEATEVRTHYSLFIITGGNRSAELCTPCLRTAARFSFPLLQRDQDQDQVHPGGETSFLCHSSGGFPEPVVYWLINHTEPPPEGSVRTLAAALPDSQLYNVTSHLKVKVSRDASVSCVIENPAMNETLMATNFGTKGSPVRSRATQAMWIFSTALCVVIGVMVLVGVVYQIHLDRISKRKKHEFQKQLLNRGHKRRSPDQDQDKDKDQDRDLEEAEAIKLDPKETNV